MRNPADLCRRLLPFQKGLIVAAFVAGALLVLLSFVIKLMPSAVAEVRVPSEPVRTDAREMEVRSDPALAIASAAEAGSVDRVGKASVPKKNSSKVAATPPHVPAAPGTRIINGEVFSETACASENRICNFSGASKVAYGAADRFSIKLLSGPASCSNDIFGDPVPGMVKSCFIAATAATAATAASASSAVIAVPVPAPDAGSMMPAVDTSRIPVGSAGFSNERTVQTAERPAPGGGIGAFRTECDFSHMAFDDPIVYPGQSGRSHLHAFFGNTGANANSTASSIANTGNSTCRGGILNRSAYWVPAMIDTRSGTPVRPTTANFYYKTGYGGVTPSTVQPMPPGLRIIAGDAKNAVPGGRYDRMPFSYSCLDGSSGNSRSIPNCSVGVELWQTVYFPQCWDGVNLDSPDHKSHMAYPTGNGCPTSHPVPLPEITFNIVYMITEANSASHWRLASDNYSTIFPGGYSGHGDWVNGWSEEAMDTFVRDCNQAALNCHSHLLGDGRAIH